MKINQPRYEQNRIYDNVSHLGGSVCTANFKTDRMKEETDDFDIEFDYDDPIVKESWTWKETLILWVIVFALFGVPILILHLTEHNF